MGIVTGIEEWRGIVRIDVDGQRLCAIKKAHFQKLPLQMDDALDEEAYLDRVAALQMGAAYEDALSLLDYSARASGELRIRLERKGYLANVVDATLCRLIENRLIDDQHYAERVVQSAQGRPIGYYALKRKLRAKGVDEDAAENALASVDGDDQRASCRKLAEKLLPRYQGQDRRAAKAKLSQALARRGFSWDAIGWALEGMLDEDWE